MEIYTVLTLSAVLIIASNVAFWLKRISHYKLLAITLSSLISSSLILIWGANSYLNSIIPFSYNSQSVFNEYVLVIQYAITRMAAMLALALVSIIVSFLKKES